MTNRTRLCLMITLPLIMWILHLCHLLPLDEIFGIYPESMVAYAYYTLAGLLLSVMITVLFGFCSLKKMKQKKDKASLQIMLLMGFWIITCFVYLYCLYFVDVSDAKPIGPAKTGVVELPQNEVKQRIIGFF